MHHLVPLLGSRDFLDGSSAWHVFSIVDAFDLAMPAMSGFASARALQSSARLGRLKTKRHKQQCGRELSLNMFMILLLAWCQCLLRAPWRLFYMVLMQNNTMRALLVSNSSACLVIDAASPPIKGHNQ